MRKKLSFEISVINNDCIKPFSEFTESERAAFSKSKTEALSKSMSRYYSNHINEACKLAASIA